MKKLSKEPKKPIFKIERTKFQFFEYMRLKVDLSQNSNELLNSGI